MSLTRADCRKLLPHARLVPGEPDLLAITDSAFRLADIPPCRLIGSPFDRSRPNFCIEVGGIKTWAALVDKHGFENAAGKAKMEIQF